MDTASTTAQVNRLRQRMQHDMLLRGFEPHERAVAHLVKNELDKPQGDALSGSMPEKDGPAVVA